MSIDGAYSLSRIYLELADGRTVKKVSKITRLNQTSDSIIVKVHFEVESSDFDQFHSLLYLVFHFMVKNSTNLTVK